MNAFARLVRWPRLGGLSHLVAWRNADVYFVSWKTDFLPPLIEPLLYLGALGFGVGAFITHVEGETYAEFLAPALITFTAMNATFFECSYGSFVRMYWQKTYDAIVSTPVSLEDVIVGELLWGATKAVVNGTIVLLVVAALGLAHSALVLFALPVLFLAGLSFGAIGILTTSQAKTFDAFNYPMYFYITPMFFLSGTFFPLDLLPRPAQLLAFTLPLTHSTFVARELIRGHLTLDVAWSVVWLAVVGTILSLLAVNAMRERLIK